MINTNKLYTWIDVQDSLEAYFSVESNVGKLANVNYRAYWNGLEVTYSDPKTLQEIEDDLEAVFLLRYNKDEYGRSIILEGNVSFQVFIEKVSVGDIYPILSKPDLTRSTFLGTKKPLEKLDRSTLDDPVFFAFHSFKGGVGRTLHAIALALHLAERAKVLLVDADFEAPGISWLIQGNISFADVLALIHSNSEILSSSSIIEDALSENVYENGNLFVLPAFRTLIEQSPVLEIKPEHIFKYQDNPFIITDVIANVAKRIGVEYVILDLRAGVSELSSSWFFDPRVNKVFVTSLSSQSVLGTAMMFKILSKFEKQNGIYGDDISNPLLIVSQVPQSTIRDVELNWSDIYSNEASLYPIREAYVESFMNLTDYRERETFSDLTDEQIIGRVISPLTFFSVENENLKSLPSNWGDVVKVIKQNNLPNDISKISEIFPIISSQHIVEENFEESRIKLEKVANSLIFADTTEENDFLVTDSIRSLGTDFKMNLPIVVVVGAKGSGKTFLYKQIVNLSSWKSFCLKVGLGSHDIDEAIILPITIPENIKDKTNFLQVPKKLQDLADSTVLFNIWQDSIKPDIQIQLNASLTGTQWRDKWLDYISWASGFGVGVEGIGRDYLRHLQSNNAKVIAVFDGLEDLFKQFTTNAEQQKALESLLQDVPNWLESQREKHLGVIVFVRKDIVNAAITQNSGQFLKKYEEYELKWNVEEALRLVHWILNRFNIFPKPTFSDWREALREKKEADLVPPLYKLWGMRMAKDSSKEAYSNNWILGSLANLKKEVQSRDIVRFLYIAAQKSIAFENRERMTDRVLFPVPIRESINEVGQKKLEEVGLENDALKVVLDVLENNSHRIEFPCSPAKLKEVIPDERQINLLIDNGVIIIYNSEYYMAEIFRKGMNIRYSRKGRPKVLYF